jgi:uncharacterized protein (TIGR03067 family)
MTLLATTATAAPAPFEPPDSRPERTGDWPRLEGAPWQAVGSSERLTFTRGYVKRYVAWDRAIEYEMTYAVRLDSRAWPRRIDMTLLRQRQGREAESTDLSADLPQRFLGVYRFQGDDLVICRAVNSSDDKRPLSFEPDGQKNYRRTVYRRKRG